MRKQYDFTKTPPNPDARRLKKQLTIRLDEDTIACFKKLTEELKLPCQTLINLYLKDCATSHRRLKLTWRHVANAG